MATGIQRKTIYDWRKTGFLKPRTKDKVLQILLDQAPDETLDFIMKRLHDASKEMALIHLSTLYEAAVVESDRGKFLDLVKRFDETKTTYGGMVATEIEREIADLTSKLVLHAREIGVDWTPEPQELMTSSRIERLLPLITREVEDAPGQEAIPEIASKFNLPIPLVVGFFKVKQKVVGLSPTKISFPEAFLKNLIISDRIRQNKMEQLPNLAQVSGTNLEETVESPITKSAYDIREPRQTQPFSATLQEVS